MSEPPSPDISALRREYRGDPLDLDDLDGDPFVQFEKWFGQALRSETIDPNAMSIATVSAQGRPGLRTVLLKTFDRDGFVFYTNLESRKARELRENNRVALLFFWPELERQVAIEGTAALVPKAEALAYFATRPRGSQLGAWVSPQSSIITARSLLEAKFDEMKRKFADKQVPIPSMWGGYRVRPDRFEFWQGRPNRLHDRFQYLPGDGGWNIARLAP